MQKDIKASQQAATNGEIIPQLLPSSLPPNSHQNTDINNLAALSGGNAGTLNGLNNQGNNSSNLNEMQNQNSTSANMHDLVAQLNNNTNTTQNNQPYNAANANASA
jgi:hypothetical protein